MSLAHRLARSLALLNRLLVPHFLLSLWPHSLKSPPVRCVLISYFEGVLAHGGALEKRNLNWICSGSHGLGKGILGAAALRLRVISRLESAYQV